MSEHDENRLTGGCFCRAVRYSVQGPALETYHCHCTMCRKTHGAVMLTCSVYPRAGFVVDLGADRVTTYDSSEKIHRRFCSICGCHLWDTEKGEDDVVMIATGALDHGQHPGHEGLPKHVHVNTKIPWYIIADGAEQDPGPDPVPEAIPPGTFPLYGGCQCGTVRYRIDGPAKETYHCHCEMCRKLHGAVVTTFSYIKRELITIEKGRGNLDVIDSSPPNHRMFCKTCGCPMFGDDGREPEYFWLSPATLDGGADPTPGQPLRHVFASHKATWFEISDDLAQSDDF